MSRTDSYQPDAKAPHSNARILLTGAILGALLGTISSYLYARAAEEGGGDASDRSSVSTGQILALLLAIVGLVRQIAELGKPKKEDMSDRK
ncbi:MAG: hypothetical protein OXG68_14530 [Chloroflexi bacterium]|nr:hypothetical protein [Chloroflexota bacterium]